MEFGLSVRLANVSVPTLPIPVPGDRMPPLAIVVTFEPVVAPVPDSVAPLATLSAPLSIVPVSRSVPALTLIVSTGSAVKLPATISVPDPTLSSTTGEAPMKSTVPASVSVFACVSKVVLAPPTSTILLASVRLFAAACSVVPPNMPRSFGPSAPLAPTASVPFSTVKPLLTVLALLLSVSVPLPILVKLVPPTTPFRVRLKAAVSIVAPLKAMLLASVVLAAAASVEALNVALPVLSAPLLPTASVPALMMLLPAKVFAPSSVSVPAPVFLRPPAPLMTLAIV